MIFTWWWLKTFEWTTMNLVVLYIIDNIGMPSLFWTSYVSFQAHLKTCECDVTKLTRPFLDSVSMFLCSSGWYRCSPCHWILKFFHKSNNVMIITAFLSSLIIVSPSRNNKSLTNHEGKHTIYILGFPKLGGTSSHYPHSSGFPWNKQSHHP